MAEYRYTSKDLSGKSYGGTIEADSIDSFNRILSERDQFCVSVKKAGVSSLSINITPKKLKLKEIAIFSRQFSTMLSSGLTVIKCLDILYLQTTEKFLKATILGVYEQVQRGESLSKAMRSQGDAFPPLFLSMVASGEASGSLDNVMLRLADQYEKENKLRNKISQAIIYPVILIGLTILVVIFMLVFILPTFEDMFKQYNTDIPITTQILMNMSNGITSYWYIILLVLAAVIILWLSFLKSASGRMWWDSFKLKVPIVGKLLLIIASSRFSSTLASVFSSGIPIVQSLEITGSVLGNRYMESQIGIVGEDVRRGIALSEAVNKIGVFPPMLCSMLTIGEESGNLDDILVKTTAFYEEESDAAIQKLIALIEPIMIILIAFIVGFIIISIITPIFSIYNSVGKS